MYKSELETELDLAKNQILASRNQKEHIIVTHETPEESGKGSQGLKRSWSGWRPLLKLYKINFQMFLKEIINFQMFWKFSKKTFCLLLCTKIHLCEGEQLVVLQEQKWKQDLSERREEEKKNPTYSLETVNLMYLFWRITWFASMSQKGQSGHFVLE